MALPNKKRWFREFTQSNFVYKAKGWLFNLCAAVIVLAVVGGVGQFLFHNHRTVFYAWAAGIGLSVLLGAASAFGKSTGDESVGAAYAGLYAFGGLFGFSLLFGLAGWLAGLGGS